MRKLRFRAWDTWAKKWETSPKLRLDGSIEEMDWDSEGAYRYTPEPDQYIIEQYTGLKDKNGKEIYEGDILHNKVGINYVVSYCAYKGRYEMWSKDGYGGGIADVQPPKEFNIEVVGNIHENPELIGKEKEHEQN